jgi:hypothetical protein
MPGEILHPTPPPYDFTHLLLGGIVLMTLRLKMGPVGAHETSASAAWQLRNPKILFSHIKICKMLV